MQMMNQYGNQHRGFGGPPQPQRQGGRRGNRGGGGGVGGGFRGNSRFEHNQNPRNQNFQGGQRPSNEVTKPVLAAAKPPQQQSPVQPQAQSKPETPVVTQPKLQPQTPAKPTQVTPNKPAPNKPEVKDVVDKAVVEQKPQGNQAQQGHQGNQSQQGHQGNLGQQGNQGPQVRQGNQGPQGNQGSQQRQSNQGQQGNQGLQGRQGNQGQQGHQGNQGQQGHQGNQGQQGLQGNQGQQGLQGNQGQQEHQIGNQNQQQKNINGNFGGANKQGGWSQAGPGGNKFGSNFGQGNKPFNKQGGPGGSGGPVRNQMRGGNRGPLGPDGKPLQREDQMLANKLKDLVGPLVDLAPIDQSEIKFNGRSRLYIGNLTSDVTEEEIMSMFGAFGEAAELFLNKEKNFGFIKMDYRVSAEKAKRELDGQNRNGRTLRVRFAPHNSAVRVKNLPPFVSNELLYRAFEIFGKIERAYVKVDERGKTLGEGVVEFVRKPSALAAIRNCTEKCFFLTSSLRPVIVESFEEPDELDGYQEKNLPKKHPEFLKAREVGPRFSELNSFEHEYGTRWKQLHELHRQKEDALKKELSAEEEKLEAQMEYAKYEHETEMLREQLRQREQDRERQKRSWEMAERAADERRETDRAALLRQEEELSQRMRVQDDELRRRQQENTLFVQAQRLNSMLDRQEKGMFDQQQPMDGAFRDQYDLPRGGYDDLAGRGWEGPRQMDDYPNKRRRF